VIMLAYVFYAVHLNFLVGIYLENKTTVIAWITLLCLLINLAGNYVLIPHLAMMGAAWARCAAYFFMAAALYPFAQRYFRIPYQWLKMVQLAVITALIFGIGWNLPEYPGWRVLLMLSFPALLYASGFFTRHAGRN
jgi:O-antigen/teichoic acid export membrane protein